MNTKLLNEVQGYFEVGAFDLEHETRMAQARIISVILEAAKAQQYTQSDLAQKTGLAQPFISALFNLHKKLSMEHIALFQQALGIVLQPPAAFSTQGHNRQFYRAEDYSSAVLPAAIQSDWSNPADPSLLVYPMESMYVNASRKSGKASKSLRKKSRVV